MRQEILRDSNLITARSRHAARGICLLGGGNEPDGRFHLEIFHSIEVPITLFRASCGRGILAGRRGARSVKSHPGSQSCGRIVELKNPFFSRKKRPDSAGDLSAAGSPERGLRWRISGAGRIETGLSKSGRIILKSILHRASAVSPEFRQLGYKTSKACFSVKHDGVGRVSPKTHEPSARPPFF